MTRKAEVLVDNKGKNLPKRSNKSSGTSHIISLPPLEEHNQLPHKQTHSRHINAPNTKRLNCPFSQGPNDAVDDFIGVCEKRKWKLKPVSRVLT